jgi:hypothetical protein
MGSTRLKSGSSPLDHEIAQEKASTMARLGLELEAALRALKACPNATPADREEHDSLVRRAGYALWRFVVHREACGLNSIAYVLRAYGVPNEVYARMMPPAAGAPAIKLII